jgi:hypothetical protein
MTKATDSNSKVRIVGVIQIGGRKITVAECAAPACAGSHGQSRSVIAVNADQWGDDVRSSDLEDKFVCTACGQRDADVRPDFNWDKKTSVGYQGEFSQTVDVCFLG